jgi:DNA-binding transcriptional LysR family regulator
VRGTARALGLTPGAVSQWDRRIPGRHHQRLLDHAKRAGVFLTPADLILGRKRCLKRNARAKAKTA